jgi:hypothetical protein
MWDQVVFNATLAAEFKILFATAIASELGIPTRLITKVQFSLGSLVVVFDVTRDVFYQISDSQLAIALNNNEIYSSALQYYTNITNDVSAGLLEPVILVQVLAPSGPLCGETCIGLCSGASVLVASAAFSLWYIFFYRAAELKERARKRQKRRSQKQENEPLEPSSASESDSEPFNESVIPPSGSKIREPFDTRERGYESDEHEHEDERHAGTAFDFSSPYGAPEGESHSPNPRVESSRDPFNVSGADRNFREPLFDHIIGDQKQEHPTPPLSRCASTSSVDIKPVPPTSVFESDEAA